MRPRDAADLRCADVLGDGHFKFGNVGCGQPQAGLELGERRPGADPELTGTGISVELFGVPARQRTEVERRGVVAAVVALSFPDGFKDQDGVRLVVEAEPGEVRESGVGAEAR